MSRSDFLYLKSQAQREREPFITLYYKGSRNGTPFTRIGFSISRKVGKANKRNRLKRLLREAFRHSAFKNMGIDCLVNISPNILKTLPSLEVAEKFLIRNFMKALKKIEAQQTLVERNSKL